jgi:hypothetical protein
MSDLSPGKLAFLIITAREFDAKTAPVEPDPGSNPSDDGERAVIEDLEGDATETELADALKGLNGDEMDELLALMWLGRGDFAPSEWPDALRQARQRGFGPAADSLMATPLHADHLAEGAAALGWDVESEEERHL